NCVVMQKK
ncbi:putative 50S ribosomal protein L17, partial [Chlamydia psittaci 10_743_SC13]